MKIAWYNTATLIVSDNGARILIDPFFTYTPARQALKNNYFPLFRSCDAILLTHGHFDHAHDAVEIIKDTAIPVYCTESPQKQLLRRGLNKEQTRCVTISDSFSIGGFVIKAYKGAHAKFGLPLIFNTVMRKNFWAQFSKSIKIGFSAMFSEREAKETVIYEIIGSDKQSVIILGSMGIADKTAYPKGADLLVLPYQGRSDLVDYSIKMLELFNPKKVLLDHFNDYAPPISSSVDYSGFLEAAKKLYPNIDIIVPEIAEQLTVN